MGRIPIKLYLQEETTGWIWPMQHDVEIFQDSVFQIILAQHRATVEYYLYTSVLFIINNRDSQKILQSF